MSFSFFGLVIQVQFRNFPQAEEILKNSLESFD